jgi:hypothetical protein
MNICSTKPDHIIYLPPAMALYQLIGDSIPQLTIEERKDQPTGSCRIVACTDNLKR